MTYAIFRGELFAVGDNLNTCQLERPDGDGGTTVLNVDFGIDDLTIDPTDSELADLPDAELARFGFSRETLTGTPAPGLPYWIVTGRVEHDDEDTAQIIRAETADAAETAYRTAMAADADTDPDDDAPIVYVLYVIACGTCEPSIVRGPQ